MVIIKILFIIIGIIFILLGMVGLILPIIPQIPFFILGLLFLCAASKRFKKMIINTSVYQHYIKSLVDKNEKLREFMEIK